MKSPAELSQRWARQWEVADNREQRLLLDTWGLVMLAAARRLGRAVRMRAMRALRADAYDRRPHPRAREVSPPLRLPHYHCEASDQ
jgi:hypothetical protein